MVGFSDEEGVHEDSISFRVSFKASSRRSARERLAPRAKRALAVARPIPDAEQVTEKSLSLSELREKLQEYRTMRPVEGAMDWCYVLKPFSG